MTKKTKKSGENGGVATNEGRQTEGKKEKETLERYTRRRLSGREETAVEPWWLEIEPHRG